MSPSVWSAAPAAGLALGMLLGCESSEPQPTAPECRPGQFQGCEAGCGRGVQQCFDTDLGPFWSSCTCVVLDASLPLPQGGAAGSAGSADAGGHGGLAGGGAGGAAGRGCGGASGTAGVNDPCAAGGTAGDGGEAGGANSSGAAGNGGEAG